MLMLHESKCRARAYAVRRMDEGDGWRGGCREATNSCHLSGPSASKNQLQGHWMYASSDMHSDAQPEKERQEKSVGNNVEGSGE